jgi:hypothetical protein
VQAFTARSRISTATKAATPGGLVK